MKLLIGYKKYSYKNHYQEGHMFFKKKQLIDCKDLVDAEQIGKPFHNQYLATATYSFPSHKDKEVMDRIYAQKKLIEKYCVFEVVNALAKITTYSDAYINFSEKFIQKIPHWSDPRNVSQTSTRFSLNGINYIAEQHSSNYCSLECLYRNDEIIFVATLITTQDSSGEIKYTIDIASSILNEKEIKLLTAFATTAEILGKQKRDASWDKMMNEVDKKSEAEIKRRF